MVLASVCFIFLLGFFRRTENNSQDISLAQDRFLNRQKWHRWNRAQQQAELDARFGPIEQRQQAFDAQQQQEATAQKSWFAAQATLADLSQQPYFAENRQEIAQALVDHEEWGDNAYRAYVHVLTTKILPNLGQTEQQRVIDHLNAKTTGTTVSPTATAVGKPTFKSPKDALEYYSTHPAEAQAMADSR